MVEDAVNSVRTKAAEHEDAHMLCKAECLVGASDAKLEELMAKGGDDVIAINLGSAEEEELARRVTTTRSLKRMSWGHWLSPVKTCCPAPTSSR